MNLPEADRPPRPISWDDRLEGAGRLLAAASGLWVALDMFWRLLP